MCDVWPVGDLEGGYSTEGADVFDGMSGEALQPGCCAPSEAAGVRGVRRLVRGAGRCAVLLVCVPAACVPTEGSRQPRSVSLGGAAEVYR